MRTPATVRRNSAETGASPLVAVRVPPRVSAIRVIVDDVDPGLASGDLARNPEPVARGHVLQLVEAILTVDRGPAQLQALRLLAKRAG